MLAGYSQGATMGALFGASQGSWLWGLMLIEGGTEGWSLSRSQIFFEEGGRRVVTVCGTERCQREGRAAAQVQTQAGLSAQLVAVSGAGHTYLGRVGEAVAQAYRQHLSAAGAP